MTVVYCMTPPNWYKLQQEGLARHGEALMAIHRAVLERYAAKVDEYRARAEKAGYTKDHPVVDALVKHAAAARMEVPSPWIPKPEIPRLEIPTPEFPKFDFTAPPKP